MRTLGQVSTARHGAALYPREQEADIVLRDGSTVHVRPVRAGDAQAIRAFLDGISPESIVFRFFGTPNLDWVTSWSVNVDYAASYALVAETGDPQHVIAHAAYASAGDGKAEVAFLVANAYQGHGISTILLAHLAAVAEAHAITTFTAEVMPSNHKMIEVFRESGFPVEMHSTPDAIHLELPTSLTPAALERFAERERRATVEAVRCVVAPRSVAVIGASRQRGTVGGEILRNLLASQFNGPVYAVNPHADVVQSLPAFHSIGEVPAPVELAVIVVPAEHVVAVARECAVAGVRALVVISSGFAEVGAEGAARQQALVDVCRAAGIRLIGPNCLGVLNTNPDVRLNATFAPQPALSGSVGFMSQSGGLGIALIEAASRLGVGLSSFVSVGNKADLSGNDMLRYWEQDDSTSVVLLYLESFGNPRKFARIAPRFARRKPLLAVKSGRSTAGARATSSHTGALLSASDVTVDALFEQAGVIRTDTLYQLFSVAQLLTAQPVPRGDRVAIVTNAGGPGIMCADACQAGGVDVPELDHQLQSRLARHLPAGASVRNPVDMVATASAADYRRTLKALIEANACDAILAIFVPPLVTQAAEVASAIREVAEATADAGVPIAAVFMTDAGAPPELSSERVRVPAYEFPEDAARAVALAARQGRWLARPAPEPVELDNIHPAQAAAVIASRLAGEGGWLDAAQVIELLGCYGLPLVATRLVPDGAGAAAAAAELGAPVALKACAQGLLHKTDANGVRLDLERTDEILAAATEIERSVTAAGHQLQGFLVQPMVADGVELIVGVASDSNFGPVVACGAGGTAAELLGDVAVRITPLTDVDAREMLRSLRTFPLLDGYRGAAPCDVAAVEQVLLRISAMVENHPEIVELDCNPLIASPGGAVIVDARIRLDAAPAPAPVPSLRA
jgi:acetyl coenzyme A synthetase (ADP forming)-like protein